MPQHPIRPLFNTLKKIFKKSCLLLNNLVYLHPTPILSNKKFTIMDSLSPNLFVKDIRATIEFYKLLGFDLIMSVPGETEDQLVWAMVTSGNVSFMFQTYESLGETLPQISRKDGGSLLFYIKVKHIRRFFD